jgi:DNA-binding NtrC family response regulator
MTARGEVDHAYSERVIVVAPTARDADVTQKLLAVAGIDGVVSQGWQHAEALIREGAGALIVTDATLADAASAGLLRARLARPALAVPDPRPDRLAAAGGALAAPG